MANRPKEVEEKIERMINAWETIAPTKSFGGMTLAQFQAAAAPSQAIRAEIADLNDKMTAAFAHRETVDAVFLPQSQLVVNGVLADPTEGPNSAIYEAFGYTRKSERKSGLTRKKKPATKV